jgi:multiple sugar transport system substrate-binding protein
MSRHMTRRTFLGGLATMTGGTALVGLAGCGGSSQAPSPSPSKPAPSSVVAEARRFQGHSLSVLAQKEYFPDANAVFDRAMADLAQQSGTRIDVAHLSADAGNLVAKQDAAVKAGNVQDLAYVTASRFVSQLHQLDDIVDVSDMVAELEAQYGPTADVNRINLKLGGKWWGIPFYTAASGWFARKDWLDEKGIKQSQFTTFAQARDVALEISDPSQNRFGWGCTVNRSGDGNGLIQSVINSYGGAVASDDGTKVIFNSDQTVEAVTFLADIYANSKYSKMLPPGVNSWTDPSNNEAWLAGIIGFTANAYSLYAQSKSQGNPVYHSTLTFPGFTGPGTDRVLNFGDAQAFVVFKGAKEQGLAKVVTRYMVDGDPLLNMVKSSAGLVLPAYRDIWTSNPYYQNGDPVFKTLKNVINQPLPIATKTGLHFPQTPSPGTQSVLQAYILTDMMGDVIQKKIKPRQAVQTANQRILQIFEQLGLKQ